MATRWPLAGLPAVWFKTFVLKNIAWLTVEDLAYLCQRRESYSFDFTRPQQRQVLFSDAHFGRKRFALQFPFGEHHIQVDLYWHNKYLHKLLILKLQFAALDE